MKEIAEKALLYDFYGPLLTAKQAKIWDLYYQQDFSLSEIAEEEGISRQAVHDLLKRTEKILEYYEYKLGLILRLPREKEKLLRIQAMLDEVTREDVANEEAWLRQLDIKARIEEIISDRLEETKQ